MAYRFFTDTDTPTVIQWYFTDGPCIDTPTVFCSTNYYADGERPEPLGEVIGAKRTWVNGQKVGSADGSHQCGTEDQWLHGSPLPPSPPIPVLADGTPTCCLRQRPERIMFGTGGQSQGYDPSSLQSHGGQRSGGRGVWNPLLAASGQRQGGHGTFAEGSVGGQSQGGSGLFDLVGAGGQQQGGNSEYPFTARGGHIQGGFGLFAMHAQGGHQGGGKGLFAWPSNGGQQGGGIGTFAETSEGGQEQGGSSDFAMISSGGQLQGGTGGSVDVAITGEIIYFGSSTPPSGFLACDGSPVSRTTYAALFAIVGTSFGVGDGSTTFNLPDMRGRTIIGSGTGSGLTARTVGQTGGEETHVLTSAESAAHTHGAARGSFLEVGGGGPQYSVGVGGQADAATASSGGGGSHNNMQPWVCCSYMIKT